MGFSCKEDEEQFFKSYANILKLIGSGNKKIVEAFQNRFSYVNTYPSEYSDRDIDSKTPGKTGYESNPNTQWIYVKFLDTFFESFLFV